MSAVYSLLIVSVYFKPLDEHRSGHMAHGVKGPQELSLI